MLPLLKKKKIKENDNKLSMQLKNIFKNYNKSKESHRELRIKVDDPAPTTPWHIRLHTQPEQIMYSRITTQ